MYILTLTFKYTYIIFLYFLGWARGVRDTRSQRRPSQWRFRSTCSCTVTHYECWTNWIWFYNRVRRVLLVSEEAEDRRLVFKLKHACFSSSLLYHAVVFLCRVCLDLMETLALKAHRAKKWVRFNNVCFQIQRSRIFFFSESRWTITLFKIKITKEAFHRGTILVSNK